MKERPILFSGAMVRAILEGRKTQTRRVIKTFQDSRCREGWHFVKVRGGQVAGFREDEPIGPYMGIVTLNPYGNRGDRLWVRETWRERDGRIEYRADTLNDGPPDGSADSESQNWRPSIFMPRAHSRLTLEITGVRVERLQEITEEDAQAEGFEPAPVHGSWVIRSREDGGHWSARKPLADLWDTINGKRGYSWSSNPWVWVVEFRAALAAVGEEKG